jgi:hypothetical protein
VHGVVLVGAPLVGAHSCIGTVGSQGGSVDTSVGSGSPVIGGALLDGAVVGRAQMGSGEPGSHWGSTLGTGCGG